MIFVLIQNVLLWFIHWSGEYLHLRGCLVPLLQGDIMLYVVQFAYETKGQELAQEGLTKQHNFIRYPTIQMRKHFFLIYKM